MGVTIDPDLLTLQEAAALTGAPYQTLQRAVASRHIPKIPVQDGQRWGPRSYLLPRADVLAWSARRLERLQVQLTRAQAAAEKR